MFLFLVSCCFNNFFKSPVENENVRLRLALAIPTGVPITFAKDAIAMLPLVADKTIKDLSKQLKTYQNNQKKQYTRLSLLLINSLCLISAIK